MKVKKRTLILIAAIVWLIAGFNVLNIGLKSYVNNFTILNIILSVIVFSLFWFKIFKKLVFKHTIRIGNFEEDLHFFLKFFDKKSFIMMFAMITLGVCLRVFHLVPDTFIAFFYTGLGSALFLAGLLFGYNFFKFEK